MKTEKEKAELSGKKFLLTSDKDLVTIREYGRRLASELNFDNNSQTLISTALSEICRNVIEYANTGEVVFEYDNNKNGITITVSDDGPGIDDINKALQEGYSTGQGLGVGLPGAKRIMDEFEIESNHGEGTKVRMCKWCNNHTQFL